MQPEAPRVPAGNLHVLEELYSASKQASKQGSLGFGLGRQLAPP